MRPASKLWSLRADKVFVVGEEYPLVVQEERSMASHRGYFAAVNEAWHQLPEKYAGRWVSPEHLRKFLLIKAGYRTERTIPCASAEEARRVAAFAGPIDAYAVVIVRGDVVIHYTAKSQSVRSMDKEEFQRSKRDVLALLDELIGTKPGELQANAGQAA